MKKFTLLKFLKIIGITAASGISYQNNTISLIADNSNFLYEYSLENNELNKISLSEQELENIPKIDKLDFESMVDSAKSTYIFGSGSTAKREKAIYINKEKNTVETISLNYLFDSMKSFSEIKSEDFNIEGATFFNNEWYFLNRGNGPNNKNVLFTVQGNNLIDDFNLFYNDFELPKINNQATGFSDATIVNGKLYFIATAENSKSTYDDGAVRGTLFGCINLKKMKIEYTQIISNINKFEGITLFHLDKKNATFLLCEDSDSNQLESQIYKLDVKL